MEAERRVTETERRIVVERRVYDRAGAVPPASLLRRCGIHSFHRHDRLSRVTFLMRFASPTERVHAWDRFNTDPEWCALRESGPVLLKEISFPA